MKKSMISEFLHYVFLNILSMVGLSCYILVDTYFIGNGVGADGLTALNLAIPIMGIQQAMGFLFSVGCGTKYSILKAQKKDAEANQLFSSTALVSFGSGIIFALLIHLFAKPIVVAMGASGDMVPMTAVYMKTVLTFTPFFIFNSVLNLMVKNDLNPKLSMIAMISGCFANIVLDYVFIYILDMSMFGAALATGAAPIIDIGILSIHFFKKKNRFRFTKEGVNLAPIGTVVRLGITSAVTELSAGIVVMAFNIVILKISGNVGVAAYGVIANLAIVVMAIFSGIAQGMQPIVSHNHGIGQEKNAFEILRYGCITTLIAATIMYGIMFSFTGRIVEIFNGEHLETLRIIANQGVKLYFAGIFFAGLSVVLAMFFNSMEMVKSAFIIAVLRGGAVMIPVLIGLTFVMKMGMTGVWLSFPVSEMIILVVALIFAGKSWKSLILK